MSPDTLQHAWEWLLNLSKIQLILLGGGISLLVAVSKVMRFLFLLGLLVVFLTALPQISKRYEQSPLVAIVKGLIHQGAEATKDPAPAPAEEPKK
ncbi:MAG TPA: hypothetical protein VGX03_17185 [Candidatus Binatia bacterium]|jgi:hypothetical protein|nr:hypothetical protein [Candidatus Binatia bacterium]